MSSAGSSQVNKTQAVTADTIQFMLAEFAEVTMKQWKFLELLNPDNKIKAQLADLLLQLADFYSTSIVVQTEKCESELQLSKTFAIKRSCKKKVRFKEPISSLCVEKVEEEAARTLIVREPASQEPNSAGSSRSFRNPLDFFWRTCNIFCCKVSNFFSQSLNFFISKAGRFWKTNPETI